MLLEHKPEAVTHNILRSNLEPSACSGLAPPPPPRGRASWPRAWPWPRWPWPWPWPSRAPGAPRAGGSDARREGV
eukprot:92000-Pyramimonas_sp.AAC.1